MQQMYLLSTAITRTKIVFGVVVLIAIIVGLAGWYVARSRSSSA